MYGKNLLSINIVRRIAIKREKENNTGEKEERRGDGKRM